MRKLLGAVIVALLIPAAAAAQRPATGGEEVGRKVPVFRVSTDAAISTAIARVRSDLAAGKLNAWGDGLGGGIKPSDIGVKGGEVATWDDFFVVAVTSPSAGGHVRVLVNRSTGAVASVRVASFSWGMSPDWWVKGLNSPPPARSN